MQFTKEYNGKPVEVQGNLGDVMVFESLPYETQQAIIRLYGGSPVDRIGGNEPKLYTKSQMIDAYEAGFEDAADGFERPWFNRYEAEHYVEGL